MADSVNEGSEMSESEMGLGGKFWVLFVGGAIACAFAGLLFFLLLGNAWARWGFLGMCLLLSAIFITIGWIVDRRRNRTYDDALGDAG